MIYTEYDESWYRTNPYKDIKPGSGIMFCDVKSPKEVSSYYVMTCSRLPHHAGPHAVTAGAGGNLIAMWYTES